MTDLHESWTEPTESGMDTSSFALYFSGEHMSEDTAEHIAPVIARSLGANYGFSIQPTVNGWDGATEHGFVVNVQAPTARVEQLCRFVALCVGAKMVHVERKNVTVTWFDARDKSERIR